MGEVSIIGLDLAKTVFQAHGAGSDGSVVFRRKLSRAQLLKFMAAQPPCVVAMEACASAHHWGRAICDLGHEVRLIPPAYVKPFVKRQKNAMADAEAIAEAVSRPTMRFVAVKSEAQQAAAMAYRTRDLLVRQRTQTINAARGPIWPSRASWPLPTRRMSVALRPSSMAMTAYCWQQCATLRAFCWIRSPGWPRRSRTLMPSCAGACGVLHHSSPSVTCTGTRFRGDVTTSNPQSSKGQKRDVAPGGGLTTSCRTVADQTADSGQNGCRVPRNRRFRSQVRGRTVRCSMRFSCAP